MSKQTAVEWLINELHKKQNGEFLNLSYNQMFDQAKEMERQNIIDAHLAGQNSSEEIDGENEVQYYNQTFKD